MARMYRSSIYRAITPVALRLSGPLHVVLYRLLRGRLVGRMSQGFMPVLLLTTVGRRTGRRRTQPIGYVRDGASLIIVASNGALPSRPGWFFNLRADPRADIELGAERLHVRAAILSGDERERAWHGVTQRYTFFEVYQRAVSRAIPLVRLAVRPPGRDPSTAN
jgi:deazaflavin-dependent oxidoreductase (nitroreductase family)